MKKLILVFCVVASFVACKKNADISNKNGDISAIKISNITDGEKRRLSEIIDKQSKLDNNDKLWLKEHLIKDRDFVYAFKGQALNILRKLTPQENLLLNESLNPNMRFIIFENGKMIAMSPISYGDRPTIIRTEWDHYREGWPGTCIPYPGIICYIWKWD